jgi:hypothetical protein
MAVHQHDSPTWQVVHKVHRSNGLETTLVLFPSCWVHVGKCKTIDGPAGVMAQLHHTHPLPSTSKTLAARLTICMIAVTAPGPSDNCTPCTRTNEGGRQGSHAPKRHRTPQNPRHGNLPLQQVTENCCNQACCITAITRHLYPSVI